MPKLTSSRRDRSDRDDLNEPYNKANRHGGGSGDGHDDGSKKKKRNRHHEDHDEGGMPDEFGRRRHRRHDRHSSSRSNKDTTTNGTSKASVAADDNDDTTPCPTFACMKLKPNLLRGIYSHGFEKPSAIQQRAIRPIVRGRDVIAQSQSGTGKFIRSSSSSSSDDIICRFVFILLFVCFICVGEELGRNEEEEREYGVL
jgi:hypothetical protein